MCRKTNKAQHDDKDRICIKNFEEDGSFEIAPATSAEIASNLGSKDCALTWEDKQLQIDDDLRKSGCSKSWQAWLAERYERDLPKRESTYTLLAQKKKRIRSECASKLAQCAKDLKEHCEASRAKYKADFATKREKARKAKIWASRSGHDDKSEQTSLSTLNEETKGGLPQLTDWGDMQWSSDWPSWADTTCNSIEKMSISTNLSSNFKRSISLSAVSTASWHPGQRLPGELIIQIIEHLAPDPSQRGPAADCTSCYLKTLHSMCLVSRMCHYYATTALYTTICLTFPPFDSPYNTYFPLCRDSLDTRQICFTHKSYSTSIQRDLDLSRRLKQLLRTLQEDRPELASVVHKLQLSTYNPVDAVHLYREHKVEYLSVICSLLAILPSIHYLDGLDYLMGRAEYSMEHLRIVTSVIRSLVRVTTLKRWSQFKDSFQFFKVGGLAYEQGGFTASGGIRVVPWHNLTHIVVTQGPNFVVSTTEEQIFLHMMPNMDTFEFVGAGRGDPRAARYDGLPMQLLEILPPRLKRIAFSDIANPYFMAAIRDFLTLRLQVGSRMGNGACSSTSLPPPDSQTNSWSLPNGKCCLESFSVVRVPVSLDAIKDIIYISERLVEFRIDNTGYEESLMGEIEVYRREFKAANVPWPSHQDIGPRQTCQERFAAMSPQQCTIQNSFRHRLLFSALLDEAHNSLRRLNWHIAPQSVGERMITEILRGGWHKSLQELMLAKKPTEGWNWEIGGKSKEWEGESLRGGLEALAQMRGTMTIKRQPEEVRVRWGIETGWWP